MHKTEERKRIWYYWEEIEKKWVSQIKGICIKSKRTGQNTWCSLTGSIKSKFATPILEKENIFLEMEWINQITLPEGKTTTGNKQKYRTTRNNKIWNKNSIGQIEKKQSRSNRWNFIRDSDSLRWHRHWQEFWQNKDKLQHC